MTSLQIALLAVAAVLVFWAVGAYNRLMRLRNRILQLFGPVEQQLRLRHGLLQQQIEALSGVPAGQPDGVAALRAACTQAQAACAHARAHPGAAGALTSLRLAEGILQDARSRLPLAAAPAATGLSALGQDLAAAESALQFARSGFNAAVAEYNGAIRQFPTWMLAGLFGFRAAGMF